MKYITTDKAPAAIGPYSQAIDANGTVYCSGQLGIQPKTGELKEGITEQTIQAMSNIRAVLEEAHCTFDNVVKTTIYLTDLSHLQIVNEIYGSYFPNHKPARVTIQVAALPKGALIEIECVAVT
ncbi:MAG: hypothetical protein ACD_48C00299G0001 [uncultured bacterium]|uniref:Reactive intermediate/imine deaminase n=1 Tax=Candidatus Roizmanbacteria bacterium RIFCSPLOWO2_01_FULL_45_11 TaxID=1802070 RepID=A0A1F7JC38_9BACT|nr:MAG: hypothetical protein ACD_48C00299G0001 [uncultured bacterium]OGK53186.1 MAG: hypothetical protein A3B56_02185 [Candidatus Roizmanbacteria bacterium RIFCSPLOWO2_01_FULL_45_11]